MYRSRCVFNVHSFYTHVNKNQLLTAVRSLLLCGVHKFCGLCLITYATVGWQSLWPSGRWASCIVCAGLGVGCPRLSLFRQSFRSQATSLPGPGTSSPQVNCENSLLLQKQSVSNTLNKSEVLKFRPISDDFN